MKFAQLLRETAEGGLSEAQDIYARYKDLKKQLKRLKLDPEPNAEGVAFRQTPFPLRASACGKGCDLLLNFVEKSIEHKVALAVCHNVFVVCGSVTSSVCSAEAFRKLLLACSERGS